MKEVSQGDFEQHLETNSRIAEVGESYQSFNAVSYTHLIVNTPFSEQLPLAQLHWIISDENESITVESMSDGLHIYDNPVGVLMVIAR